MIPKAVLDTNVLISGVFWTGPPFEVLRAWQDAKFALVISAPILEEYRRVLHEMTATHPSSVVKRILELIEIHSQLVTPHFFAEQVCSDRDDDKFLEAAVAANAGYVITGDTALLRLKNHLGVNVLKPARFLELLGH